MSIDWIPARKITAKEEGNRGIFPSNKVPSGIVEYESCLERDFLLLCSHDPSVRKFQHQPITINYKDRQGKERKYTPDVYVEYTNGSNALYEVKFSAEVAQNRNKYMERWNEAARWGNERGMSFSVITEREIRTPRWGNVWFTLGSSKCVSNNQYVSQVIHLVPENGESYNVLCNLLAEDLGIPIGKAAQILCYAIYHGLVVTDTFSTQQISGDSVIRKRRLQTNSPFKPLWEELRGTNYLEQAGDLKPPPAKALKPLSLQNPVEYDEKVLQREKVVKMWLSQPSKKRTSEWRRDFCECWGVPLRTVYRWANSYDQDGLKGLVPAHGRAGRSSKFDDCTSDLMNQANAYYLQPLITLKNAYRKLESLCGEQNLQAPSLASFRRYVYQHTSASELARKRGKKFHKANYTPALASFQGACHPMQVLQVDNTSLDVFLVDSEERESLPTPYMTAAIDCYTRMITGFSVSLFPSSSRTVTEVLVQSILPKGRYEEAYATQQEWPVQGFPVVILVDNGMDYRAEKLRDFCLKYDIIIEYVPLRTPRYKAFIEDWFAVLHKALEGEQVPGTRPLLKSRLENPELKPEAGAVLTLQEIETWLHKWVVDEYHFTNPYGDYAPAPFLRWSDACNKESRVILPSPRDPPQKSTDVDQLYMSTLEKVPRTLQYRGVTWAHLLYNSPELAEIYKTTGKRTVDVMLDRRDIRQIWVANPLTGIPIQVGLGSGWAQAIAKVHGDVPIHASAWKKDVTRLRMQFKHRITAYLYQKETSRVNRQELVGHAKKDTRSVRAQKEKAKETQRKSRFPKNEPYLGTTSPQAERTPPTSQEASGLEAGAPKPVRMKKAIDWTKVPLLPTDDFPKDF